MNTSNTGPLISLLVTCFNYEKYVAAAIESGLGQTYLRREIVVVDDGSTDGSAKIIGRYADRVRVLQQRNQGQVAATNNGFAATSGDIIILLDADDLLEPDALARIAAAWSPLCAKVQWDLKIIDSDGNDLGRRFCSFDSSYDAERVRTSFQRTGTYRWPVSVGNGYSRWFANSMFPLTIAQCPEGVLNTVAPVYGDVVTIPDALGSYRIHGTNLWSSTGLDLSRLPDRIEQRLTEVAAMRHHAESRGMVVPWDSVLDSELTFINYRLMAAKLGLTYPGSQADSPRGLRRKAYSVLRAEKYPLKKRLVQALWFEALSIAPRKAATLLMQARFRRVSLRQRYSEKLAELLPWKRQTAGSSASGQPAPAQRATR